MNTKYRKETSSRGTRWREGSKKARSCSAGETWENVTEVVGFEIIAKGWIRVQQVGTGKAKVVEEKNTA